MNSVDIVTGASQGIDGCTAIRLAAKWMTRASVRMDGGETKGI